MQAAELRKVQVTVGFSPRQHRLMTQEAHRLGISFGDLARRLVDEWADRLKLAQPTKDPRASGMYRP